MMIDKVTAALSKLISLQPGRKEPFRELADAKICYCHPSEMLDTKLETDMVNLFLFDVREDIELRRTEYIVKERDGSKSIIPPAVGVACSYLITVWCAEQLDCHIREQLLIGQALQVLVRYPYMDIANTAEKLTSDHDKKPFRDLFAVQEPPLTLELFNGGGYKNQVDFWSSLGIKMRTAVTVTVTISLPIDRGEPPAARPKEINVNFGIL